MEANPTGFELHLDRLVDAAVFAPSPEQSQCLLVRCSGVPMVVFWLNGRWETHAGDVATAFESWMYLC